MSSCRLRLAVGGETNMRIIAEAGVNHNGDENLAFKLVDAAVYSGADVVKFQTYKTDCLVTSSTACADYQIKSNQSVKTQKSLLSQFELSYKSFERLKAYCDALKIEFMTTAFDYESLKFVSDHLNLKTLKISSGDLTNAPFLLEHARTNKNIILSTGMSNINEIKSALSVLAFGYLDQSVHKPKLADFVEAYSSECGKKVLRDKVTLLHCTSAYPAPDSTVNLNAIKTLNQRFKICTGFSDHSLGIAIPIASVALGITLLEKHLTLDKTLEGPDHSASLEPIEFKKMVEGVCQVSKALGNGEKIALGAEKQNMKFSRRSIVAEKSIEKGELFDEYNLSIKRAPEKMSPYEYWRLLGSASSRNYSVGELIDE